MENDLHMMFLSHLLHHNHKHHILIDSLCSLTENRRTLKLVRRHLVMSGLKKNSEFICLSLKVFHERADSGRNGTKIMVLKLLILRRSVSDHCSSTKHQIRTCIIERLVYKEILLFNSKIDLNGCHIIIKKIRNRSSSLTKSMKRLQIWYLSIESLTCIRYKDRRYT